MSNFPQRYYRVTFEPWTKARRINSSASFLIRCRRQRFMLSERAWSFSRSGSNSLRASAKDDRIGAW